MNEETDLRIVLTCVRTTRLLTGSSSSSDGLNGTLEKVAKFKRLNEIPGIAMPKSNQSRELSASYSRVPDHAPVLNADLLVGPVNLV